MNNFFKYYCGLLEEHIGRYYHIDADSEALNIVQVDIEDAATTSGILIINTGDIDLASNETFVRRSIPFYGTQLTFFGVGYTFDRRDWRPYPCSEHTLFWVNKFGGMLINWNFFSFSKLLLTHRLENRFGRDKHARITEKDINVELQNLYAVPIINEICAVIVDYYCNFIVKANYLSQVKPIEIALSHDIDLIRGDDFYTQIIRVAKAIRRPKNIKYVLSSFFNPERYHLNNIIKLINLESKNGLSSTFYVLNGSMGRFRARSNFSENKLFYERLFKCNGVDKQAFGIHYNYDTYLDDKKLASQVKEMLRFGCPHPEVGRAHYLRFKYPQTFKVLENNGLKIDETVGFSSILGFRSGIAGLYKPYNPIDKEKFQLSESPLFGMDQAMLADHANGFRVTSNMLSHVAVVGGRVSFLFHHDYYDNPEFPCYVGFYDDLIKLIANYNFVDNPAHLAL